MRRRELIEMAAAGVVTLNAPWALAQSFPARPLRLLVPFTPGGGTDTAARIVMKRVGDQLGQPVVVENKPGAGGAVAYSEVVRTKADGHTLTIGTGTRSTLNLLFSNLTFNAATDLEPVAPMANVPIALVASKKIPVKTVEALIRYAKLNPGLNYGTPGATTPQHLAGILFASMTGTELVHTPYRGTAQAVQDVLGGHLPLAIVGLSTAMQYAGSGKIQVLGVGGSQRSELAPEIPTISEAGVKGYEAGYWYDITVAKGTSDSVIDRLHAEITKAVQTPEVCASLISNGFEPMAMARSEYRKLLASEHVKWERVIKTNNIRAE